ncbi:hypothetical protein QFZ55_003970 [Streptomyces luteogriseus]|nr:hypothetical protein [Streptomyces luteogriseus]MDQ0714518.1 hypothetical protein [Streptomyces luteogriseus]
MPGVLGETLVGVGDETLDGLRGKAPAITEGETGDARREVLIGQDRRRGGGHGNSLRGVGMRQVSAPAGISWE